MADYPDNIYEPRVLENLPSEEFKESEKTTLFAEDFNKLAEEVVAIEETLGKNPQDFYTDLKTRLSNLPYAIIYTGEETVNSTLELQSFSLDFDNELSILLRLTCESPFTPALYFNQDTSKDNYIFIGNEKRYAGGTGSYDFGRSDAGMISFGDGRCTSYNINIRLFYLKDYEGNYFLTAEWTATGIYDENGYEIANFSGSGRYLLDSELQYLCFDFQQQIVNWKMTVFKKIP